MTSPPCFVYKMLPLIPSSSRCGDTCTVEHTVLENKSARHSYTLLAPSQIQLSEVNRHIRCIIVPSESLLVNK